MRMTREAARPTCNPASAITNVMSPNNGAATHGEYPSSPRLVPATTLSALNGTSRPNTAHGRSNSSVAAVRHALMIEVQAVGAERDRPDVLGGRADRLAPVLPDQDAHQRCQASQTPNTNAICRERRH